MLSLTATLSFIAILAPPAFAQQGNYTVWSSVIFQRTGDRTPEIIGPNATILTSLGQRQANAAGAFFRNRYIASKYNGVNGTGGGFMDGAPMPNLEPNVLDTQQTYVATLDQQYNIATAIAWFQGMYPPYNLSSNTWDPTLDPTNFVNGSYLDAPLGGYQYPEMHVAGPYDPNYIYLGAHLNCPAFGAAAQDYSETPQFAVTRQQFDYIYNALDGIFSGALTAAQLDYFNAYAIFDWVNYQNTHNQTISDEIMAFANPEPYMMDTLRYLANEQQLAQLGNLTAVNPYNGHNYLPETQVGSISTIAGNMLVARVVDLLTTAIESNAAGMFQLNVLFADHAPLMSFFALMGLPQQSGYSNTAGMADFGASAAFELFSYETSENPTFPNTDNLMVRFLFRNGTEDDDEFRSYPLFGRGQGAEDMDLNDFLSHMGNYVMGDVSNWCTQCGSQNEWCAAYNTTSSGDNTVYFNGNTYTISSASHGGLKPVVAGVIGAVVSLAVAALLFAGVMLLFGVRLHRNKSRRQSDLGGFKGGQKMASDQDLTIPKGGAIVGASIVESPTSPTGGHERVGSWELKQAEAGRHFAQGMRPSMEQARRTPDITEGVRPVKPLERV